MLTGTQTFLSLETQFFEHNKHTFAFQSQLVQPISEGLAEFDGDKMHDPLLRSYPL